MVIALQSYKKKLNYDELAQVFNCFTRRKFYKIQRCLGISIKLAVYSDDNQ